MISIGVPAEQESSIVPDRQIPTLGDDGSISVALPCGADVWSPEELLVVSETRRCYRGMFFRVQLMDGLERGLQGRVLFSVCASSRRELVLQRPGAR